MYRQTVKDQYVARIYLATNPLTSCHSLKRNLRDMQIFSLVALNPKAMRAFQNLQRPHLDPTVVQRYPNREELRVSAHELVVLMRMRHQALAMREDQPANRFWMNQNLLPYKHFHHL